MQASESVKFGILEVEQGATQTRADVSQTLLTLENLDKYYEDLLKRAQSGGSQAVSETVKQDIDTAADNAGQAVVEEMRTEGMRIIEEGIEDNSIATAVNLVPVGENDQASLDKVNVREELPMEIDKDSNGVTEMKRDIEVCRPKENSKLSESTKVSEDERLEKEMLAMKFAAVQVTALKAVQCVLASQKYGEMLLVPKSDLVADSSKALTDGTVVRKDEDFKKVMCEFMKKLIHVATSASPFKRAVGIDELDRTRAMLQKMVVQEQAGRKTNLPSLKGEIISVFKNITS